MCVGPAHGGDYGEIPGAHALLAPDPVLGAPGHHQHSHRLRGAGKPGPVPRARSPCLGLTRPDTGAEGSHLLRVPLYPGTFGRVCSLSRVTFLAPHSLSPSPQLFSRVFQPSLENVKDWMV
uniref:Uncharacterized protein n=1 Tax=Macaca fascicularis TaxID=9541 RepID=Q95KA8_MACFA|nr:hypothetical protein [Macaca fascicularis]